MATPTYVGKGTGKGTGTSATTTTPVGLSFGENLITVQLVLRDTTRAVSAVAFGAEALTKVKEETNGTDVKISQWELLSPVSTSEIVTATFDGSTEYEMVVATFTNVSARIASASNTGNGTTATITRAWGTGTIFVGVIGIGDVAPTSLTPDASITEIHAEAGTAINTNTAYKMHSSGANMVWTLGAGQKWAGVLVEYSAVATSLAVSMSPSPTATIAGSATPGFVERETLQIDTTVEDIVEVLDD